LRPALERSTAQRENVYQSEAAAFSWLLFSDRGALAKSMIHAGLIFSALASNSLARSSARSKAGAPLIGIVLQPSAPQWACSHKASDSLLGHVDVRAEHAEFRPQLQNQRRGG
jgi:hypothetical protein